MKKSRGVTLLELMIGIAIAAILATLAVPSFNDLIQRTRLNATANQLLSAANYARSEALKRNQQVSLCHSAAPESSPASCGGAGSSWDTGWIVFIDGGARGTRDGADIVLRTATGGNNVTFATVSSYEDFFGFRPTGRPHAGAGNGNGNGTIHICNNGLRRSLSVNVTGRVSLRDETNNSDCAANL